MNPVLYRDGRDAIGYHADDDQGEDLILSVLVASPVNATRKICIFSKEAHKRKGGWCEGDKKYELLLDAGDAYSMDGTISPFDNRVDITAYWKFDGTSRFTSLLIIPFFCLTKKNRSYAKVLCARCST